MSLETLDKSAQEGLSYGNAQLCERVQMEEVRVNLILKGELARAFEAEYRAEVKRSLDAGERRPPSIAEVARAVVQDGLRKRGHAQVEDGVSDWGGSRKDVDDPQLAGIGAN
jgi:hypothetical protein